ncbi:phage holin family protein [Ramlibacter algicola]|uniref:phage holin family protein n=1 Tax=Ramlibacter algicola TaxID=2795217 RepID=UPI001A9C686B|nr:phage holin family protein [Ramlibacter algicola]
MSIVHPIFSVLVSKPDLVMEHVAGYAALVKEEATTAGADVTRRAAAWAACAMCALVFLLFTGIAVMLGAVAGFHWTLVVVPLVPLVGAGIAFAMARKRTPGQAFAELRAQLEADAQALRTLGGRP